jgi:hypothetical protein
VYYIGEENYELRIGENYKRSIFVRFNKLTQIFVLKIVFLFQIHIMLIT